MNKNATLFRKMFKQPYRQCSHSEMIQKLLEQQPLLSNGNAVFVEIGAGSTTFILAELAKKYGATLYSCDVNREKVEDIKARTQNEFSEINYLVGDSLESLSDIANKHNSIHFIFFDSAPSAMHTFREFIVAEKYLKPGSCILIDNAALPGETSLLTPCRKGKVLVPYLLASPVWKVMGHPHAGDSMVSAVRMENPDYADPDYERPGWTDYWEYLSDDEKLKRRQFTVKDTRGDSY